MSISHEQRGRTNSARNLIISKARSVEELMRMAATGSRSTRKLCQCRAAAHSAAAFRLAPDAVSKAARS